MHTLLKLPVAIALACAALAPAWAATPIDQVRPLDPRGRVEIDNLKGRVEVRAWDRQEVRVTGSLGDGVEKLVIDGDRDELRIEVKYPNRSRNTEPTMLVVQVPLQAELEIETVSADIDVHGVAPRELSLQSVSGDIVANGAPRRASVESVSGDVNLTFNSSEVEASTVSGDLVVGGGTIDLYRWLRYMSYPMLTSGGTLVMSGNTVVILSSLSEYKLEQEPVGLEYGLLEAQPRTWHDRFATE